MIRLFFACFLCLCPILVQAETLYPDYSSTTVNDFAGLLNAEQSEVLEQTLQTLRKDTGVEMTVVTLNRQATYNPDISMEEFATGLFNHWGVGDAGKNDGVMVLVLYQDRAMRIELGAGFGPEWDRTAKTVIERSFLPKFRENYFATGILHGVDDTIKTIVVPFKAGEEPPATSDGSFWLILVTIPFALIFGWRWIGDRLARFGTCPQCATRGTIRVSRRVLTSATTSNSGAGERRRTCQSCGFSDVDTYVISRKSRSSGGSGFGGGRSSGGGASGKW